MKLVIGNKNYSSWSFRPWILLDAFNVAFDEVLESLKTENLSERLAQYSDSKKVPVLIDNELVVWDTLAICEYVSENYLDNKGWPEEKVDRALARSICSEMHSSFVALRAEMPMNCKATRKVEQSDALKADIARIDAIWSAYAKETAEGDIRLFGQFSIADCFYAPVVFRFNTYKPVLSDLAKAYMESMLKHPSMQKWMEMSKEEEEVIERSEVGADF